MVLVDKKRDAADREIVLSRALDAPRELVWKVWTEPEHVVHWWGPDGFTTSIKESDEKGGLGRHPLSPEWPREMLSSVTLAERRGKTEVTVRWVPLNAAAEETKTFLDGFASMTQGWTGTFERLAEHLAKT